MEALELAKKAAAILDEKKAVNLNVIRIGDISSLADYFVIGSALNNTHVRALSDDLEVKLKAEGVAPQRIEGYRSNSWVLLDYGSVVVHLFTQEARNFYDLDRLWADGEHLAVGGTQDAQYICGVLKRAGACESQTDSCSGNDK